MTRIKDAARCVLIAAAIVTVSACGDDDPVENTGSIQVAVNPATLTVPQGGSGSVTAQLTRGGGFTGDVTLAVSGLPTGVTTTITPPQLSGTTATATIAVAVAATVAAGNYTATVTGTAQGVGQASATYQLTVTQPAPADVEYRFCHDDAPSFFAWQDGSGAWQGLSGTGSGDTTRYEFTVTQGRGGVMLLYQDVIEPVAGFRVAARSLIHRQAAIRDRMHQAQAPLVPSALVDVYQTVVIYASAAELAEDGEANCDVGEPTKTITGTVANVPEGAYGIVALGPSGIIFDGAAATNPVTFSEIPEGPVNLVGSRTFPGEPADRLILVRNLDIPDGGSLPSPIDFDGPASLEPADAIVTIGGGSGHNLEVYTLLVTANGVSGVWNDLSPTPVTSRPWVGLGPAATIAGDFHGIIVFASANDGTGDFRVAGKYVGPVSNQNLDFGPTIDLPGISQVASGAYPRFRFQGTLQSGYNKGATFDLLSPDGLGNSYTILATSAWLSASGNSLAYDFTMPDFTTLPGFPVAARLTAGVTDLMVSGFGFTGQGIFESLPSVGTEFRGSLRNSTITVP